MRQALSTISEKLRTSWVCTQWVPQQSAKAARRLHRLGEDQ